MLVFYLPLTSPSPKNDGIMFPHASQFLYFPSILPSFADAYFWLVIAWKFIMWLLSKPTVYFMFIHFWLLNSMPQMMVSQFPCTSCLLHLSFTLPTFADTYF